MIPVKNWPEIKALESQMRAADNANILDLFKIASLDPRYDFRCQDWRFVKFDELDLRGCDFERSRVYGATFAGAQVAEAKFRGSDVQVTRFYLAPDWELADLSDDQRSIIRMQSLAASGKLDRESFEEMPGWKLIDEPQWVRLIKSAADFERAHEIYKMMSKVEMGNSKYAITTLLDKAANSSQVRIAKNYFIDFNITLDSFAVSALISKANSEKEAREIFERYKNKCEHTQYLFNSLISKCSFLEAAEDIFSMMEKEGIKVDEIALNPFIWKAQNFTSAMWIYKKLSNPRTADLNALLSHAKWHQYFQTKEVQSLLTNGPVPDLRTFNIIIGTCDNLSDGLSVIKLMKSRDHNPDKFTLFATLSLISNGDIDRGFDLLVQFIGEGVSIEDQDVVRVMVRICENTSGKAGRLLAEFWESDDCWYKALIALSENFASKKMNTKFRIIFDAARAVRHKPD